MAGFMERSARPEGLNVLVVPESEMSFSQFVPHQGWAPVNCCGQYGLLIPLRDGARRGTDGAFQGHGNPFVEPNRQRQVCETSMGQFMNHDIGGSEFIA